MHGDGVRIFTLAETQFLKACDMSGNEVFACIQQYRPSCVNANPTNRILTTDSKSKLLQPLDQCCKESLLGLLQVLATLQTHTLLQLGPVVCTVGLPTPSYQ